MSLIGTLNLGRNALAVQQAALQVTGNNISNAGNADYTRQVADTSPSADQQIGPNLFLGTGVNLDGVQRQIDESLEARLRSSTSDNSAADASQQWLSRIESTFNALGDGNLSSRMSKFFNSWSDLANKPQDAGLRQVVLTTGQGLAQSFIDERNQLTGLSGDVQQRIGAQAKAADGLAQQVADLNGKIITAEGGGNGQANNLRDQRDSVIKQLSQLVDLKTVQQPNGTINVYVGSEPLVVATTNQGITVKQTVVNNAVVSTVAFKATGGPIKMTSGELAGLQDVQSQTSAVTNQVDSLAHGLIFELNKVHASGQGLGGFRSTTSTNAVADPTAALNTAGAGLPFTPVNGSFVVHVTNKATGQDTSTLVKVDLDGLNNDDTTLNSLAASLNGISGVTATINAGKLTIAAGNSGVGISFSQDSSGTLAALGVNSFFAGKDASDIAVNSALQADPTLLAAAKNGDKADNQTALAIAALQTQSLGALNGASLNDGYQSIVNGVAGQVANAKTNAEAAKAINDTLTAQRSSLSGVSLDEEAVNLMQQQRAFQGAARLITTIDQMMQTVLNMIP